MEKQDQHLKNWAKTWFDHYYQSVISLSKWQESNHNLSVGDIVFDTTTKNKQTGYFRLGEIISFQTDHTNFPRYFDIKYKIGKEVKTATRMAQHLMVILEGGRRHDLLGPEVLGRREEGEGGGQAGVDQAGPQQVPDPGHPAGGVGGGEATDPGRPAGGDVAEIAADPDPAPGDNPADWRGQAEPGGVEEAEDDGGLLQHQEVDPQHGVIPALQVDEQTDTSARNGERAGDVEIRQRDDDGGEEAVQHGQQGGAAPQAVHGGDGPDLHPVQKQDVTPARGAVCLTEDQDPEADLGALQPQVHAVPLVPEPGAVEEQADVPVQHPAPAVPLQQVQEEQGRGKRTKKRNPKYFN